MTRIMIKCPTTGLPVFTGIDASKEGFETGTFIDNAVVCPLCRQKHVWQKEDAYLEGD